MKKQIDRDRVAAALARLDELVRTHPELGAEQAQGRLRDWLEPARLTAAQMLSDRESRH